MNREIVKTALALTMLFGGTLALMLLGLGAVTATGSILQELFNPVVGIVGATVVGLVGIFLVFLWLLYWTR